MSDTQGASDLSNDMPGLGPETGNVRGAPQGLPSQLQGLVRHFIQSQGPANPKFLPPPPMGAPQPRRPPPIPSGDPPDPTVRSFSPAPPGRQTPPPQFTPYMQPLPRDHTQWGQPEPFARQPASFELGGMYTSLGNYFSQHGGFASLPLGAGTATFAKAYQDAYEKGMDFKMRLAREQTAMQAQQLENIERERSIGYADIFSRHSIEGTDPRNDLWAAAVKTGDQDIIRMAENGDSAEKMRRFLADHEAHIRALSAANKKQSDDEAGDELYGLKPRSEGGGAYDPYTNPTGTHGGAPAEGGAAPSAAAPAAPAGQVAGPGAPSRGGDDTRAPGVGDPLAKPDDSSPDADADNIADPHLRNQHNAAVEILRGNEPKDIPKNWLPAIGVQARNLRDTISKIVGDAKTGKIARDQVMPEIRKQVGGSVADDLQDVLDYRRPGLGGSGQGGTGGKEGEYLGLLGNAAGVIEPGDPDKGIGGWNPANFRAQEDFRTNVNTQTVILRSNSLAADAQSVRDDLKELERQGRPATGLDLDQIGRNLMADPLYAKLHGDWLAYNDAFNTVVTAGRHVESGAQAQANVAPTSYASPAAFRAVMKGHMKDALGYLEGEHRRWETDGGKEWNMPSYNPKTEKELRDIRDMDYLTGTLPGQTYTNRKGVTKTWKGGSLNPYDTSNWE